MVAAMPTRLRYVVRDFRTRWVAWWYSKLGSRAIRILYQPVLFRPHRMHGEFSMFRDLSMCLLDISTRCAKCLNRLTCRLGRGLERARGTTY